jgi:hypothetical protein
MRGRGIRVHARVRWQSDWRMLRGQGRHPRDDLYARLVGAELTAALRLLVRLRRGLSVWDWVVAD